MKAIIYLRVSTEEQNLGIKAQRKSCQKYLSTEKIACAGEYQEKITGSAELTKRPALTAAIAALERGDILLVAKRDRLGRGDPLHTAMIESAVRRKGCSIVSVAGEGTEDDEPTSLLMRRMVDAFAEYERLIIGFRTKSALAVKKANGERMGHVPFGYKVVKEKNIEECEEEQKILSKMQSLKKEGLSVREIAKYLNNENLLNRGLKTWNHSSVHRMVSR